MPNAEREEWACRVVAGALVEEGFAVSVLGRPDAQQSGVPAPDFELQIDHRCVALEVVEFHIAGTRTRSRAETYQLQRRIKARIDPLLATTGLAGAIASCWFDELPTRRQLHLDERQLVDAIAAGVGRLRRGQRTDVVSGIPWVRELELVAIDNGGELAFVTAHGLGYALKSAASEFLERTVSKKADQVRDYELSILAVIRGIEMGADALREATAGHKDLPWTRVYAVDRQAALLWERGFPGPSARPSSG